MTNPAPGAHSSLTPGSSPKRPGVVRTARAYWGHAPTSIKTTTTVWAVAALFVIVSALILIGTQIAQTISRQDALNQVDGMYQQQGDFVQGYLVQQSQPNPALLTLLCIVVVLLALLAVTGYVVVGYNVLAGRNAARIVGSVLAVGSLFLLPLGLTGVLVVLLSIGGAVLSWIPASSAYLAAMSNSRAASGIPR
jgi:hypothetical protein